MRSLSILALAGLSFVHAQSDRCGAQFGGLSCIGNSYGSCCSQYNYCGSTSAYCGSGCQPGYGDCSSTNGGGASKKVSKDGSCGGSTTCLNSAFGNCCSRHGYCGSSSAYCGDGCNPSFGTCNSSPVSSRPAMSSASASTTRTSSPAPSPSQKVSTNGRCGSQYNASPSGMTCLGSKYGGCCSQYSYCGSTKEYCSTGCQSGFGKCDILSSSIKSSTTLATSTRSGSVTASSTARSSSLSSSVGSSSISSVASSSSLSAMGTSTVSSNVLSSSIASSSSIVPSSSTAFTSTGPSPSPSAFVPSGICGRNAFPIALSPGDAFESDLKSNLSLCSERCRVNPQCQYLILLAETQCYLYNKPLSQEGNLQDQSDLVLYERTCFPPLSPTFSSSVVSTSTAPASSTGPSSSPSMVSSAATPTTSSAQSSTPAASSVPSTSSSSPSTTSLLNTPVSTPGVSSSQSSGSSSTPTPSPVTPTPVASSSSPASSSAAALPSNFCAVAITTNTAYNGATMRSSGSRGNLPHFAGRGTGTDPVAYLDLLPSGEITTGGSVFVITPYNNIERVITFASQNQIDTEPDNYVPLLCSVAAGNTLKCTVTKGTLKWNNIGIADGVEAVQMSQRSASTATFTFIDLGIYYGADCV